MSLARQGPSRRSGRRSCRVIPSAARNLVERIKVPHGVRDDDLVAHSRRGVGSRRMEACCLPTARTPHPALSPSTGRGFYVASAPILSPSTGQGSFCHAGLRSSPRTESVARIPNTQCRPQPVVCVSPARPTGCGVVSRKPIPATLSTRGEDTGEGSVGLRRHRGGAQIPELAEQCEQALLPAIAGLEPDTCAASLNPRRQRLHLLGGGHRQRQG